MSILDKMIKVAEDFGWNVVANGNEFELQKYSPAGQDFNMHIVADNVETFVNEIKERHEGFDVSSETYVWLDSDGHGKNGAPYDMKDLYEDMEACKQMISELAEELENKLDTFYRLILSLK